MAEQMTQIDNLMQKLSKEIEKRHNTTNAIKRQGKELIIPEYMTPMEASKTLRNYADKMEMETQKEIQIIGHPTDLLFAFQNAMVKTFGNLTGEMNVIQGFFGPMLRPSLSKTIKVGYDKQITVPYGQVSLPSLPQVKIEIAVEEQKKIAQSKLFVWATYAKKYEPLIEMIETAIYDQLQNNPVFKGQAVDSRYEFLNLKGFPLDKIVYSAEEKTQLGASIFRLIKSTEELKKLRVSIKRTVLLHGKFGTGKTLTALLAANVCVANGWTFLNVRPGDDITSALELASKWQPCCVFFEDIDAVTSGGRDEGINRILNTIDGILSKTAQVLVILTTNNVEKIEKAMLRPGRIDAVIEMGNLSKESMVSLIDVYCGKNLVEKINEDELWEAARDYTPSFIAEACARAHLYALDRVDGNSSQVRIKNEDLREALKGLRSQFELMSGAREKEDQPMEKAMEKVVLSAIDSKFGNGEGFVRRDELKSAAFEPRK